MIESIKQRKYLSQVFGFELPIDFASSMIIRKYKIDVVKLNEMLKVPDDISLRDFIKAKYGNEIVKIVEGML